MNSQPLGPPPVPLRADLALSDGYHSPQLDVAVRLNTNESPYPPPGGWLEALRAEVAGLAFHRYPDRSAMRLREAIGETHGVGPDQVFCGNGSNEVIQMLLLCFGGPGRRAAVFEPTYALHSHIARLAGTEVVEGERSTWFELDEAEVARVLAQSRPELTFLCSPNNPTGRSDSPEAVQRVLQRAPGLVVVDEAYGQFSPWSAISLVGSNDRLVVVRTFSKTWSMAAFRLGYLVASPAVVEALSRVALPYHLDAVKQLAGRLALAFDAEMRERVALLVQERGRLSAALGELEVDTWPSDANFVLFRPWHRSGHQVWQELVDRSVLVRDCSSWPRLEGCLRVTVGSPSESSAFLAALAEVLA